MASFVLKNWIVPYTWAPNNTGTYPPRDGGGGITRTVPLKFRATSAAVASNMAVSGTSRPESINGGTYGTPYLDPDQSWML